MTQYQWSWMRLFGTAWSSSVTGEITDKQATVYKEQSEKQLTEYLANGWQIVTVLPAAPNGVLSVNNSSHIKQEAWTVFLQKPLDASPDQRLA